MKRIIHISKLAIFSVITLSMVVIMNQKMIANPSSGPEKPKCKATMICSTGKSVSCDGKHYCSAYLVNDYVVCDGVRTHCEKEDEL